MIDCEFNVLCFFFLFNKIWDFLLSFSFWGDGGRSRETSSVQLSMSSLVGHCFLVFLYLCVRLSIYLSIYLFCVGWHWDSPSFSFFFFHFFLFGLIRYKYLQCPIQMLSTYICLHYLMGFFGGLSSFLLIMVLSFFKIFIFFSGLI